MAPSKLLQNIAIVGVSLIHIDCLVYVLGPFSSNHHHRPPDTLVKCLCQSF